APASPEHLDQPIENEPKRPLAVDQALSESASTQNVQPTKKSRMNFNVRSILEESEIGVQVSSELDTDILSRKSRIKMVQILVAYIINRFGERPHADVKIQMAKSVVEEFPFLKDEEGQGYEAWYTSGKGIHSATGWLEERLRNVRRKSVKHRPTEKDLNTASTSLTHLTTSLPELYGKTVLNRAEWIRKTPDLPMREVMKEYPRLFDTPGMVEIDFRTLYADVAENLFLRLTPPIVEKIISYADTQAEKWTMYLHMIPRNLKSDEERKNAAIGLLPCVFPTGRKNRKRCTIDEALSAFIDCQPVGTNMPKYLEEAPRCPFVLAIGNRYNPTQVFVIIEGQGLEQPNLTKAIDVCFKVFYILDINYPWQCSSSWEFIQKVLYGIEDKVKGKTTPAVVAMRAALK
ncbi:Hypothetical predicted protein, partial [Paramuricea clavata]